MKWARKSALEQASALQEGKAKKPAERIKRPRKQAAPKEPEYHIGDLVQVIGNTTISHGHSIGSVGTITDVSKGMGWVEVTVGYLPQSLTLKDVMPITSKSFSSGAGPFTKYTPPSSLQDYWAQASVKVLAPSQATLQSQLNPLANQSNNQGGSMATGIFGYDPSSSIFYSGSQQAAPRQSMQPNRYNVGDKVNVRSGKTVWTITDMHIEPGYRGAVWQYRLEIPAGAVNQEAEDQLRLVENVVAERPKVIVDFETVVIADEKRQQILEALEQINQADLIFDKWGFGETIEKGKGVSMLFYGPPGTGKTLMAQAIANKLGKKLKVLAVADIESNMPGEAERNIREAFKSGKNDVLLFDECDSLVYSRQNVGPIMAAQVNELLSQLERFDGVTIFTTNRLGNLDEAVNRRLALKLGFDMPTHAERIEIWKRMFPKQAPLGDDIDWELLAIVEMTGGYIKNAVLRAARMAAAEKIQDEDKKIHMKHLRKAVRLEAEAMVSFTDALEQEEQRFGRSVGPLSMTANGKKITLRKTEGANG